MKVFPIVALSLCWTKKASAFPTAVGGCPAGTAAVGGSHNSRLQIVQGPLSDFGLQVVLDGNQILDTNAPSTFTAGVDHTLTLNATNNQFLGVLFRLGSTTADTTAALQPQIGDTNLQVAQMQCIDINGVGGISHTNRNPKSQVTGILRVDVEAQFALDVTVVIRNAGARSEFYYSPFVMTSQLPTTAPTMMPVTPAPTILPVTPAPTMMPVTPAPTMMPFTPAPAMTPVTPAPTMMPFTPAPTMTPTMLPVASPPIAFNPSSSVAPIPFTPASPVPPFPFSPSSPIAPIPFTPASPVPPFPFSPSSPVPPFPFGPSSPIAPVPFSPASPVPPFPFSPSSPIAPIPFTPASPVPPFPFSPASPIYSPSPPTSPSPMVGTSAPTTQTMPSSTTGMPTAVSPLPAGTMSPSQSPILDTTAAPTSTPTAGPPSSANNQSTWRLVLTSVCGFLIMSLIFF